MKRLRRLLLRPWEEFKFAVAATRWEGWGAPGDIRNGRPLLTREEWRRRGKPWTP